VTLLWGIEERRSLMNEESLIILLLPCFVTSPHVCALNSPVVPSLLQVFIYTSLSLGRRLLSACFEWPLHPSIAHLPTRLNMAATLNTDGFLRPTTAGKHRERPHLRRAKTRYAFQAGVSSKHLERLQKAKEERGEYGVPLQVRLSSHQET
jgi:hypothetical protein